ncbi:MAG: histidine phosphatase family protein, partial [Dehalococcoidia bacterium]|nr:histidine phosphatase family protein [Dehalococcoidia bacterium]
EGESLHDAFARQRGFLERASGRQGSVLVAGHGGTLRVLAILLLGFEPRYYWRLRGLGSASISVLSDERGPMALYAWNETGHLGDLVHAS